uniref:Uncharacterized protein n=1 Tax=Timema tahoe TaxID=61484 RepID=A0A7R9NWG0_9NEOP|nr:unnamed protein product [Timema tahoe]
MSMSDIEVRPGGGGGSRRSRKCGALDTLFRLYIFLNNVCSVNSKPQHDGHQQQLVAFLEVLDGGNQKGHPGTFFLFPLIVIAAEHS